MPDATMPDDRPPATAYDHLIARLRADQPVEASRAVLEACFGLWSRAPELCEDGRATMLTRLPAGGALYLARTGEVLAAHSTTALGYSRRGCSRARGTSSGRLWLPITWLQSPAEVLSRATGVSGRTFHPW